MPRRSDPEELRAQIHRSGIDEAAVQDSVQYKFLIESGILKPDDLAGLDPLQAAAFVMHLKRADRFFNDDSPDAMDAGWTQGQGDMQVDGETYRQIVVNALDWLRRGKVEIVEELPKLLSPGELVLRKSRWPAAWRKNKRASAARLKRHIAASKTKPRPTAAEREERLMAWLNKWAQLDEKEKEKRKRKRGGA